MKQIFTLLLTTISLFVTNQIHSQGIYAGYDQSFFSCDNGVIMSVGSYSYGGLGNGVNTNSTQPSPVIGVLDILKISTISHSLFLKNDGTVWVCGLNGDGRFGIGPNIIDTNVPILVSSISSVVDISAGFGHSLFLKSDGTVWACGKNHKGQLGNGSSTNRSTPVQVSGMVGVVAVAAGFDHSMFLKNDGTVWACGWNLDGNLGDSSNLDRFTPVKVRISGVAAIAAGDYHSLFLKHDGTVWACGWNDDGQLGDGTRLSRNTPVRINGLSNIASISARGRYSLFRKTDGTVFACGKNQYGQLGDGTNMSKDSVVRVSGISDVIIIAAGYDHSLFLKSDGTFWSCGRNVSGALGDGTIIPQGIPIQPQNICLKTGIEENNSDQNVIRSYPNPVQNTLTVTFNSQELKIILTNLIGEEIYKTVASGGKTEIDVSHLPSGMYFVNNRKFVKE